MPGLGEDRDQFELGLIGWCLKNSDEFEYLVRQIRKKHFKDLYAVNVWPYLLGAWERNKAWPTQGEAVALLQAQMRTNPLLPPLVEYVKQCYQITTTDVTGDEIKKWVTSRELLELSNRLQETASQLTSLSQDDLQTKLAESKIEFAEAMDALEGESVEDADFDPFDGDAIDNLEEDIEEDYGAPPLPTGFARLDAKLRDGGVRPHGVLLFGPSGGGKTMACINILMYNVTQGKRGVLISFDDAKAELRERIYSHIMAEELEFSAIKAAGKMDLFKSELKSTISEQYPGRLIIKALDPEMYSPSDIIKMLEKLRKKLYAEDKANGKPEEECGVIDFVAIDTGDQVKPETRYKSEWYEVGKTHQILNVIPKRFNCPLFVVVQGGQQTVGAAQLTERDIGEGYAKAKPYKLILGVAQTHVQYQTDIVVSLTDSLVRDNLHNLHNLCIDERDRSTKWKPFTLCVIKNTRGRSKSGSANKVKLPMLINYGSCRIIENYTEPESALLTPLQTQRDEVNATVPEGGPIIRRTRKRAMKND